ncbi:MAG TPA: penicillin-binding protein [Firmicutes bacterium]|nr:penicillin-binding protein [Bacillota bacterium]
MRKKKKANPRQITMAVLLAAVLVAYTARAAQIQVVNAQKYLDQADTTGSRRVTLAAARGEILDRYGRPIAVNREGYNIVFNSAYLSRDDLNNTIARLTDYLQSAGQAWTDNLPLSAEEPFGFAEDASESDIASLKNRLGVADYATAENCFTQMVGRYSLEGLDRQLQRTVMGVRYTMEQQDFSVSNPFTLAEDVSSEVMTRVTEAAMPGVEISVVPFREYVDDDVAPHLIGTVGPIYAEDWEELRDKGYSYNDKVGRSGMEQAAEEYLRGQNGTMLVTQDASGNTLSSEVTEAPVAGNTVLMSIDKNLQRVAQVQLKNMIDQLKTETNGEADAGAVVGVNVKTGGVLFSANYPSYTMTEYKENYTALASDSSNPLFDRAFNGLYPPGSVFKPAVAAAGLQEGVITPTETIRCVQRYTRFADYQPKCLGYHGSINVTRALSRSCNYFFYETGYRLGISRLNQYCQQLGLGVATGVEVQESRGILAGPEERKNNPVDPVWRDGDTIQAAIGQSDTVLTPLQLAVYTATMANGGTRYQASLIHEVRSYDLEETVVDSTPTVLNTVDFSQSVIETVKEGMLSVTEDGTGRGTFANYPIRVGGKTGTAQVPTGEDNSVFVAFAPYDDPEIAVSVVIEHGGHGSSSGSLVRAIFDAYFFSQTDPYVEPAANTLLP